MRNWMRFFLFILCGIEVIFGQNLVRNHDFNLHDPNHVGIAVGGSFFSWTTHAYLLPPPGTMGVFGGVHYNNTATHPISTPDDVGLAPVEGRGYMTLSVTHGNYDTTRPLAIARGELTSPLIGGVKYCAELHTSAFFKEIFPNVWSSCYAQENIGLYFSDTNTLSTVFPWQDPSIVPQVLNTTGYINDPTKWVHVKNSFVANGGEQFVFVSNWQPSPLQQHFFGNGCEGVSYALIDAIYCYVCDDTLFTVDIGKDTTLCVGETLSLHAMYEGFKLQDTTVTFAWQTPNGTSSDSSVVANEPGYYEVTVTINQRFTATSGIWVHFAPAPPDADKLLPESQELCAGGTIRLTLPDWEVTDYQWSTGATTRSISVNQPGLYSVVAENDCWYHEESVLVELANCGQNLWIPDAFTPDGDGLNDVYEIIGSPFPLHLTVFDRWGSVVFDGEDYQNNWNGTYPSGEPVPEGVYTYHLRYYTSEFGGQKSRFGSLRVFRTR